MRSILVLAFFGMFLFILPAPAHAVIFLPAIILIPIAKIVAVIIGGLTFPTFATGIVSAKLFGKPVKKILLWSFVVLILIGIVLVIFLKLTNPERPLI